MSFGQNIQGHFHESLDEDPTPCSNGLAADLDSTRIKAQEAIPEGCAVRQRLHYDGDEALAIWPDWRLAGRHLTRYCLCSRQLAIHLGPILSTCLPDNASVLSATPPKAAN